MRTRRYEVNHHSEEFVCHVCETHVDVGDYGVEVECNQREATFVVCSHSCDTQDFKEWEKLNKPTN